MIHDSFDVLKHMQDACPPSHLRESLDTVIDYLLASRNVLSGAQDMLRPRRFVQLLRAYIEDVLGAPCETDGCRPGELFVYPACFGYTSCDALRIALLRVDEQTRVLLTTAHCDVLCADYAELCHICNELQAVLGEEAPGSLIYITDEDDDVHHLRLCMDVPIARPEDIAAIILRASFLVHKYHNAILAELDLTLFEEDEVSEDEEAEAGEYSSDPFAFSVRHGSPHPRLKTDGFRFSQSEAFRRMMEEEEEDEEDDEEEVDEEEAADGDPFEIFSVPPVPPRRPHFPIDDSEGGMNDENPF